MLTPGERFKGWVDGLGAAFADRIGVWAVSHMAKGIEKTLDDIEPELVKQSRAFMETVRNTPGLPPETKALFDGMLAPKSFGWIFAIVSFLFSYVAGIASSMLQGYLEPARQQSQKLTPYHIPDLGLAIDMKLRGKLDPSDFDEVVSRLGWSKEWSDRFFAMKTPILPSDLAFSAWLRDKAKYQKFVDDLPKLGLSPESIELLTDLAYRVPGSQDVIRYMVKEVYNPATYKAFGQDQEFPGGATEFTAQPLADAEAAGVRREHLLKEWIAHWNLPGSAQGFDLLHRGEITEDELAKLLKALDIMPFWRDKLTALSWDVPNRVELRMLARYGLVDRQFLIDALKNAGLRQDYRPILADLMLAQGLLTDMSKRYTNKWINSDELRTELNATGMDQEIIDRLYIWIVKNNVGDRMAAEKNLTAAEIIKGVKKNVITWDEGVQQLIALGYDEVEADYKMAIDIEVVAAEPTTELNIRVDTIRRQRRQRLMTRDEEIAEFINLGLDSALAAAYADNDDMRLVKVAAPKPPEVIPEYQTEDGKVNVETIRLARRQRRISRLEEITSLTNLEMSQELAVAYADNDDLRLVKVAGE